MYPPILYGSCLCAFSIVKYYAMLKKKLPVASRPVPSGGKDVLSLQTWLREGASYPCLDF